MPREIITEIAIQATPERVWQILTDFPTLPQWNPMMVEAKGEVTQGSQIAACLQLDGKKPMWVRPWLVVVDSSREMRWKGKLFIPDLFDVEHRFVIEPNGDGVRFIHSERFTGILVEWVLGMIGGTARLGFEAMNSALKTRAESGT